MLHALVRQRTDGLPHDQVNQIVGRVVAARVLAREHVRTDDDVPAVADDLPFQQSLVDRADLLHAEIPVVDVAASERCPLERQRVDHVSHHRVTQPNARKQGRALPVEQSTVVGRQADGCVTRIDGAAQVVER